MFIDYYNVLGVQKNASALEIKAAYRRLAMLYHPDRNKSPSAAQKFIEITEAYEVLIDSRKRALYDNLYESVFVSEATVQGTENSHQHSWSAYGRQKAEEYSSMPYDVFTKRVLDEAKIGARYIPNVIFIFICLTGMIGGIMVLPKAFTDRSAPEGTVMIFALVILISGTLAYFLYKRMRIDYMEERRRYFKKN